MDGLRPAHSHGLGWIQHARFFKTITKPIKEYPEMNLQFNEKANWKAVERICAREGENIVKFTDWLTSTVNPSFDDAGMVKGPRCIRVIIHAIRVGAMWIITKRIEKGSLPLLKTDSAKLA